MHQPAALAETHCFRLQSRTQEVPERQKGCLMLISSGNSSNPFLNILNTVFFCFKDPYCLFSPSFHCPSCAKSPLLHVILLCIVLRGEKRKCRCHPSRLLSKYTIFPLSCSHKNYPVCIKNKTTCSQLSISGLLQLDTDCRNSYNGNSE